MPPSLEAQSPATCAQILPSIQKSVTSCSGIDRDQICYGNQSISAVFQDDAAGSPPAFAKTGDAVGVSLLKSIRTAPLDLQTNTWGIAVLKIRARNLDDTTLGQAVTFILYGDTNFNFPGQDVSAASTAV